MKSNCKMCDVEFSYYPSQKSGLFCSTQCNHDYRTLKIMESGEANKFNALTYLKRFHAYECSVCSLTDWMDKPISLQIDHIDGDRHNNTIDNVRWICPNCHSQTETWGSRNASPDGQQRIQEARRKPRANRSSLSVGQLEKLGR